MTEQDNSDLFDSMVNQLLNDPDKYERMFALQWLVKYNFAKSVKFLIKAMEEDPDPEVAASAEKFLKKAVEDRGY